MDLPVVPIQRKAVYGNNIHGIKNAMRSQQSNEVGINRRYAAQHHRKAWVLTTYALAGRDHHGGKELPVRITLKIPVGEIIWFIPQHDCFNHALTFAQEPG